VRKRRAQVSVLGRMCRTLLGQDTVDYPALGRLAKRHGAESVANAILSLAGDGGCAGPESIAQILEGRATDSLKSPETEGAPAQREPGAQAEAALPESGRGESSGRGGAGSGPPAGGDVGAGGDGPPKAQGDAGSARRSTRKRAAAGKRRSVDDELLAMLQEAGIQQPSLGRLLEMPGLTAQDARAWLLYARQESGLDNPAGYAIRRMLDGDGPPGDYRLLAGLDEHNRALFQENLARLEDGALLLPLSDDLAEEFVAWAGMRGFGEGEVRRALRRTATGQATGRELRIDDPPPPHVAAWDNALDYIRRSCLRLYDILRSPQTTRVELVPAGDGGGLVRLSVDPLAWSWVENRRVTRLLDEALAAEMGEGWRWELVGDTG